MKVSDIISLANAGYTKEEISELFGQTAPTPAPAPAPETASTPETAPAVTMESLSQQISGLTAAIQLSNIANSTVSTAAPQTAEGILAGLIAGGAK